MGIYRTSGASSGDSTGSPSRLRSSLHSEISCFTKNIKAIVENPTSSMKNRLDTSCAVAPPM